MRSELIKNLQNGLEFVSRPFESISKDLNTSEEGVIEEIKESLNNNIIKRFGAVISHRILGYKSNAMVVWDIPDEQLDDFANKMAAYYFVRLCYQRPRRPPQWNYNLFCMVFGKTKEEIENYLSFMIKEVGLEKINYEILYTTKCYKQKGATYR